MAMYDSCYFHAEYELVDEEQNNNTINGPLPEVKKHTQKQFPYTSHILQMNHRALISY
jgi:hypothetical protein